MHGLNRSLGLFSLHLKIKIKVNLCRCSDTVCRERNTLSYCDPALGTKLHLSKVSKQFVDELLGKKTLHLTQVPMNLCPEANETGEPVSSYKGPLRQ